jgi:Mn-dependent DtxR family transcriptional regulator
MSTTKYISTSALVKELKMSAKDLFQRLLEKGLINREMIIDLTDLGKEAGGA